MKITIKSIIEAFFKGGQIVATSFLFLTFMGVFFHGQFVWTEPNMTILTFEILLSALWLIGSLVDTVQAVQSFKRK